MNAPTELHRVTLPLTALQSDLQYEQIRTLGGWPFTVTGKTPGPERLIGPQPDPGAAPVRDGHGYYHMPDGRKLISVTTVIDQGIPKPQLLDWTAREVAHCAMEWVTRIVRARTDEDRAEVVRWLKGAANRKRDAAAALGGAVHDHAEAHALGAPCAEPTIELLPFIAAFARFCQRWRPRWEASEMVLAHYTHGWAGTGDAWMWLVLPDVGPDPVLVIVDWKGLGLDTPLPTPTGWTTMGAVAEGDHVIGGDGRPCKVTGKSDVHWRNCYRVHFDDGSSVICDDQHLWETTHGQAGRSATSVSTTDEIRRTLLFRGQKHHRVRVASALELPEQALPVHPYVFGCWLGDGKRTSGEITKPDDELFDLIAACGYTVGPNTDHRDRCRVSTVYGLMKQLRRAGLLGYKAIPDLYLRASAEQRLALLQGLMDTDGTWNTAQGRACFVTVDKAFAASFRELALSLGQRAVVQTIQGHGFGKAVTSYRVMFTPIDIAPFRLTRKAERVKVRSTAWSTRRVIVDIEPMPSVPTQCIAVDSPDHTYLCTEAMIPTHNSGSSARAEVGLQLSAYIRAEVGFLRDGTQVTPPRAQHAAVVHIRPEKYAGGYAVKRVDVSDDTYQFFRNAQRTAEGWVRGHSKTVLQRAYREPPIPASAREVA